MLVKQTLANFIEICESYKIWMLPNNLSFSNIFELPKTTNLSNCIWLDIIYISYLIQIDFAIYLIFLWKWNNEHHFFFENLLNSFVIIFFLPVKYINIKIKSLSLSKLVEKFDTIHIKAKENKNNLSFSCWASISWFHY